VTEMSISRTEVINFVNKLNGSEHVAFFYDTRENKYKVLFSFLSSGLSHNKGALYVCSEESPETIRRKMNDFGINVIEEEQVERLLIRPYAFLCEPSDIGQVEVVNILANWKNMYQQYNEKGFGLRIAEEMSYFFAGDKIRELLRYEYALHRVLDIPIQAISAYNVQAIVDAEHAEVIMPLIRAHCWTIITGPKGNSIKESREIEDCDVEQLLEIKI
jgi:hypothetical protein